MAEKVKNYGFMIFPKQHEALYRLAYKRKVRSMSVLVREALDQYVKKQTRRGK